MILQFFLKNRFITLHTFSHFMAYITHQIVVLYAAISYSIFIACFREVRNLSPYDLTLGFISSSRHLLPNAPLIKINV